MKDQHMRAHSPFYSKPLGTPEVDQFEIREDIILRLSIGLTDKIAEESKKDPSINTCEVVEAINRFLAVQSVMHRRPGISKPEFIVWAIKRLITVINTAWSSVVKIETREGVAG